MRSIALLALMVTAASVGHRSQGYAGSTPVGLDGYTAFARHDCKRINLDRRRSRQRVPLSVDCAITIPAPDGRVEARAGSSDNATITLSVPGGFVVSALEQPVTFLWNPNSHGFLLNDGEGSGQISHLRYFYRTGSGWRETRKLASAADAIYRHRFDCRGGKKSYTNISGWDWTHSGLLRVIVQEGVHSEGCLQPDGDRNVLFEVIGDPVTGKVASAREIETLA